MKLWHQNLAVPADAPVDYVMEQFAREIARTLVKNPKYRSMVETSIRDQSSMGNDQKVYSLVMPWPPQDLTI